MKRQRSLSSVRAEISRGSSVALPAAGTATAAPRSTSSGLPKSLPKGIAVSRVLEDEDFVASEDDDETVERQLVVTKYKAAGNIVDEVIALVAAACVPGSNTFQLCKTGNEELQRRTAQTFTKQKGDDNKRLPRGIAYPCNVSVNNSLCNHAPTSLAEAVTIKAGDVVKIHCGAHIDGYPCSAARTIVVSNSEAGGDCTLESAAKANCIEAARVALLGMLRLLKPGAINADVTDFIHSVGHHFEAQPVEGVLSTRTKRWVIDGMQAIIARRVTLEDPQQDVEEVTVRHNQVWTLDVAFTSSPSYKTQPTQGQTNIFRKNEIEMARDPRLQASTDLLNEIKYQLYCFPFHLSQTANPVKARLAIAGVRKEAVIDEMREMQVKGAQNVTARFSATICISKNRVNIFCGLPPSTATATAYDMTPELRALLEKSLVYNETQEKAKKRLRTEAKKE